jgi:hypothetical protein
MRIFAVWAFAAFLSGTGTVHAADKTIGDFAGQWIGSGKAQDGGAASENRDGEVIITKTAEGFTLEWTTMRTQAAEQAAAVVKASTLKFKATAKPNVFHALDAGDPLKGKKAVWASISGSTLRVSLFTVESDGNWTMQVYDRMLKSPKEMAVSFKRISNGEVTRKAELTLTLAPKAL